MAMDVWRREDVFHVLRAVALAVEARKGESDDFHTGVETALRAIGTAFGIDIQPGTYTNLVSSRDGAVCSGRCKTCPVGAKPHTGRVRPSVETGPNRQQLPG